MIFHAKKGNLIGLEIFFVIIFTYHFQFFTNRIFTKRIFTKRIFTKRIFTIFSLLTDLEKNLRAFPSSPIRFPCLNLTVYFFTEDCNLNLLALPSHKTNQQMFSKKIPRCFFEQGKQIKRHENVKLFKTVTRSYFFDR